MPEPISEADVRKVAKLARLRLDDTQLAHFTGQLGAILEYISKLNELDVADVEPMAHPLDLVNVLREDTEVPGMPRDAALDNAPDAGDGFFKVPKVLGDADGSGGGSS